MMTRPPSGAGPGNDGGRVTTPATTKSINYDTTTEATVPQPKDSPGHRRLRLHHMLVRRPRWSAELDELLADLDDEYDDQVHVDYHRDHLDRTIAEREEIGRELAAAGWVPR